VCAHQHEVAVERDTEPGRPDQGRHDHNTFYETPPNLVQKGSAGLVQSNDDRMNQVIKYGHSLHAGVTTGITDTNGTTSGVACWGIAPHWKKGALGASAKIEGPTSVAGNSLAYPSIAVDREGAGVMVVSLIGPVHYPCAAYIKYRRS
jgi:hypothetical protein